MVIKMLTREELKAVHNNIITIMENRVMQMTGCNRQTANLVANEILDLDRDADKKQSKFAFTWKRSNYET